MVDDSVKATVATVVSGIVLCELLDLGAWTSAANSSAWTWAYSAANWCLFLLPTAYAVVTVLHPGFGLIDYSVYGSLDHVISRVVGRALTEGRPPGERGFWLSVGVVAVLVCWCIPRSAAICGALAFAYDFHFYKTDAPELCFAGDLCRALLYVARCPWPAVVATLATAVVTLAIPCWIIAARIPVVSFCVLFLYVLCNATGCAKVFFSYGKLGDDGSAATVILLAGCAAASWWTPHVSLTFAVVFTGYDVIFVPVTAAGEVEAQHILAKDLRRMYREHAKPRLENMFGLENMQNIGEGAVAAAVGVPFVAAYVAIFALGGESAPVTSDAGSELPVPTWAEITLPPVGRWGAVAYDWVRWGGRCAYFVGGSLQYFTKVLKALADRLGPDQLRLQWTVYAGALVPYALLCYYKVELVVAASWVETVRVELKRREDISHLALFFFGFVVAPSTIADAVATELWHEIDPAASLVERLITAYLGLSWVDFILGNDWLSWVDWLRIVERLVKMAYGASIVFKRLTPAAAPPTYRVAFAALAYLTFFEMWHYVLGRPCRVPVLYVLGGGGFMASPLADRLWNSEDRADEAVEAASSEDESDSDSEQESDDEYYSKETLAIRLLRGTILNAHFCGDMPVGEERCTVLWDRMCSMPLEIGERFAAPLVTNQDLISECLYWVRSLPPEEFRRMLKTADEQADEQAGQMQDFMEAFERDSGIVIPDPTPPDSPHDGGSFQRASEEKLRTRRVVKVADRFRHAAAETPGDDEVKGETDQRRSRIESMMNSLAGGDQQLAAGTIKVMPQSLRASLAESLGITPEKIGEYAEQVLSMPSEDMEKMNRAILPRVRKDKDSAMNYAILLVKCCRATEEAKAKAAEETDRLFSRLAPEERVRAVAIAREEPGLNPYLVMDRATKAERRARERAAAEAKTAAAAARAKAERIRAERQTAMAAEAETKAAETDRLRREAADSFALPDPAARTEPSKRELAARKSRAREKEKEEKLRAKRKQAEERRRKQAEWEAAKREEAARAEAERAPSPDDDEAETASEASVEAEARAKAADQAAAELLAAEEAAEASAAAAKKKKKKRRGKRGGAAPIPTVNAPSVEEAVAEPTIDEPQQHDEVVMLLHRLGLEERVGPVFAREQIDENALPFLTVEDLVEAGVAAADARKIVSTVEFEARRAAGTALVAVPDAEPAAEPADTAAEEPATAAEDTPAAGSVDLPERLCCPISLELMERPVMAADGHTYDRRSIEDWLARGNTTSPTTGAPLEHLHLVDNHLVKSMVAEYVDTGRYNAPF